MKRFSLRLTEAEHMKLKIYCDELHLSMNDVIRHLIREWHPDTLILDKAIKKESKCR